MRAARGVAGLDDVLGVLNERRVETLLIEERFQMPGTVCPQCGSLFPENVAICPADGTATERYDDIVEEAVELAVDQSADVIIATPLRRPRGDGRDRRGTALLAVAGLAQETT